MKALLIVLLSLLPQHAEPWKHQLDLEAILGDSESQKKLTIMYDSPLPQGFELVFVRGDGSLILQRYPGRPMARMDVSTCTDKIGQDQVKQLLSLIASRHFWELPEKNFLFLGGEPSHKEFQVHRIFISDGTERAGRVFADGTYPGKQEAIPEDFAVIEQQFKQLAQSAFAGKACHLAPAVQF
jgi:hypothetical protein